MKCPECGKEVDNNVSACSNCGYPFQDLKESENKEGSGEKENNEGVNDGKNSALDSLIQMNDNKSTDKRKKFLIAGCVIAGFIVIGLLGYFTSNRYKYSSAQKEYQKENYAKAADIFKKLGDYKNSAEMHQDARHKNDVKNDVTPPTISCDIDNIILKRGEDFDFDEWIKTDNVIAEDDVTEDPVLSVEVTEVDTNTAGEYKIVINAKDEAGNEQS